MIRDKQSFVSRRRALQLLAFFGATGPLARRVVGQAPPEITPEVLRTASALIDQELDSGRLEVVAPALQRNLDQFQIVRELEIDDRVEPAAVFLARWR